MTSHLDNQDETAEASASVVSTDGTADAVPAMQNFAELAGRAQSFLNEGKFDEARDVFATILTVLGEEPTYQRAVALERLGFCQLMEGQPLAAAGFLQQSSEIVEAIPLSAAARALQGVIQSELGQIFSIMGYVDQAREAFRTAIEVARGLDDKRALGIDLDHLGVLALKHGDADAARAHFEEALAIFRDLGQPGAEALALHHLGVAQEQSRNWDDAEQHYTDAARILVDHHDFESASRLFCQAASVCSKAGRAESAEAWFRNALEHSRLGFNPVDLRRTLSALARLLATTPDGLVEARQLIEEALAAGENSLEPDIWELYGQLADVIARQAASVGEAAAAQSLDASAQSYRHIHRYGPRLLETLKGIGEEPSFGAAVILERIGRCCLMGGRPAPAVILLRQAVSALDTLPQSDSTKGLRGVIQSAMGDAYRLAGFPVEAGKSYQAALEAARDLKDLREELMQLTHLGAFALAGGEPDKARERFRAAARIARDIGENEILGGLEQQIAALAPNGKEQDEAQGDDQAGQAATDAASRSRVHEDIVTECAFGSDLLIEVRRETRLTFLDDLLLDPLPHHVVPAIVPGVRMALDESGALRFHVPSGEPELVQERDCVVMRKSRRDIVVAGHLDPVWTLVRFADGARSVAALLEKIPQQDRAGAEHILTVLAAQGAFDVSGRPVARYIHAATKKGVLAGGGLEGAGVLDLAADGNYRSFPDAPRIALDDAIPDGIRALHDLTRTRRSRRDYSGTPVARADFDAVLHTACGLTGVATVSDRTIKLRSYPSSGALYAVEIYPVVMNVEGLEPGVYHYVAADNALEAVKLDLDFDAFIDACLPVEREMVSAAGSMICLVGEFRRHERKYGEGGYRMMVAEAGHISQNLVLSSTALGLSARPFGGVFDTLVNRALCLDESEEQFLLSVLIAHAAEDKT